MTDEPHGHRGHPTYGEMARAGYSRERVGALIHRLTADEQFSEPEALAFIAGVAHQKAVERGEAWWAPDSAVRTLTHVFNGGYAKTWSLDAINLAVTEISDLLDHPQ